MDRITAHPGRDGVQWGSHCWEIYVPVERGERLLERDTNYASPGAGDIPRLQQSNPGQLTALSATVDTFLGLS